MDDKKVHILVRDAAKKIFSPGKTGKLVKCDGEAHEPSVGGMIDHCGVCMPRWGLVEEREKVTLAIVLAALDEGLIVPWFHVPEEIVPHLDKAILKGDMKDVTVYIGKTKTSVQDSYRGVAK